VRGPPSGVQKGAHCRAENWHHLWHYRQMPPAGEETLRSAYDEDPAEFFTVISADVPPWLSRAQLCESPR
jgi:hypothetical protein